MHDPTPGLDPFAVLSPVTQELVSAVAALQRALAEERRLHAAEVRGLAARLEAAEAETEMLRRDLDRMRTGHMTGPSDVGPVMNGTAVAGARA